MARPGITFEDVTKAATLLLEEGKNPTIEQVRLILGSGSSTTIANYLKQWKQRHHSQNKPLLFTENLPQELTSLVKNLWDRLVNHSQEKIIHIEADLNNEIERLTAEVQKYKNNNQRWQQLFQQWQIEKEGFEAQKKELENKYRVLQNEVASYEIKLQEKEMRLQESQILYKQILANAEKDNERMSKERIILDKELKEQKNLLDNTLQKMNLCDRELHLLQQSHQLLQKNYAERSASESRYKDSFENSEKLNIELQEANKYWQMQFQTVQKTLESKIVTLIEMQADNKNLNKELIEIKKENQQMMSEKKQLFAEKAELQSELKHLQKVVTA